MYPWYESWLLWLLIVVVACLLAILIAVYIWWRLTVARRCLLKILRNISDRLLRNVVLPDGVGGHIGVDALLLRDARLYVLVIRNVEGAVFGGEKLDHWTAIGRHKRFSFRNPLRLMQDRSLALRALTPEFPIVPRVLFTGHCHFPKGRPGSVELLEEFAASLRRPRKFKPQALDPKLEEAWTRLREAAGVPLGKEVPPLNMPISSAAGT